VEIVFLTTDEALAIHRDQIARYGGSPGLRDAGLLDSALATPQTGFGGEYLRRDLFEMAAAYLLQLVKNHPFVDGNKRPCAHSEPAPSGVGARSPTGT
jgi:death-on-curing protein